jgi:hypothetical protein
MPHAVLETCFLRGLKNYQAAQELGISERQLSRERTRALQLLAEELTPPAPVSVSPDRVPSTDGHLGRDALVRRLAEVAAKERLVAVVGRRGTGKTSAVAALARLVRSDLVWWLRIRAGLNDSLETLLLELGRTLSGEDFPALGDYLLSALPRPNLGTATRLALDGLARSPRLLVIDDFDRVLDPAPVEHFLQEAVERVDQLTVIAIGKGLVGGPAVEVPPLSAGEAVDLGEAGGGNVSRGSREGAPRCRRRPHGARCGGCSMVVESCRRSSTIRTASGEQGGAPQPP